MNGSSYQKINTTDLIYFKMGTLNLSCIGCFSEVIHFTVLLTKVLKCFLFIFLIVILNYIKIYKFYIIIINERFNVFPADYEECRLLGY
jgi:hypothetical protein